MTYKIGQKFRTLYDGVAEIIGIDETNKQLWLRKDSGGNVTYYTEWMTRYKEIKPEVWRNVWYNQGQVFFGIGSYTNQEDALRDAGKALDARNGADPRLVTCLKL